MSSASDSGSSAEGRGFGNVVGLQDAKRLAQILKQSATIHESRLGVFVQRVSIADLKRLRSGNMGPGALDEDPLQKALSPQSINRTFRDCANELSANLNAGPAEDAVNSSIDMIIEQLGDDTSRNGQRQLTAAQTHGAVFVAWQQTRSTVPGAGYRAPQLVGICTTYLFVPSSRFDLDSRAFRKPAQYQKLHPFFRGESNGITYPGEFKKAYIYIDVLCSKQPGVGQLLLQNVYRSALQRKVKGVLALAFTKTAKARPKSQSTFERQGFQTLVNNVDYDSQQYGNIMLKRTYPVILTGVDEQVAEICVRTGFTKKTANTLVTRCQK